MLTAADLRARRPTRLRPYRARTSEGRRLALSRALDADGWRETVRGALCGAGTVPGAAAALGLTARTLQRWLTAEPALRAGIAIRPGGRPTRLT